mgnify:FL=1
MRYRTHIEHQQTQEGNTREGDHVIQQSHIITQCMCVHTNEVLHVYIILRAKR